VLSTAFRDVIPVMDLLKEIKDRGYNVEATLSMWWKLFRTTAELLNKPELLNTVHKPDTSTLHGIISGHMLPYV
jgi:hypothetical protein